MDAKKLEKFRQVVAGCGESFAILIAQVDQDAVGTAELLRVALESMGKNVDIYYAGKVSQLNQALFNIFELDKKFTPMPSQLASHYTLALVDSSMTEDKRFGALGKIRPKLVIDHHRGDFKEEEDTWSAYQNTGSAAAIAAKLVFSLDIDMAEHKQAATLGALGILGDTDGFEINETTNLDRQMFAALMEHGDQERLTDARKYPLPDRYYEIWRNVLATEKRAHATLVASGGYITEEEKDYLARIANKLKRWRGVTLVVVWAIVDDDRLTVKARSTDPSDDLSEVLKRKFGNIYAGAKTGAGGAEIPLEALKPSPSSREHLLTFLLARMNDLFHGI